MPLYQGNPANHSGFFKRGNNANLIVMALPGTNSAFSEMDVIFHEYAHVLLRHNAKVWPLWLSEGVADIYSTFETSAFTVRIARPIEPYLRLLRRRPFLPLEELFAVTHRSPHYNESNRQGMFYAQSWLLTHYLMAGGTVAYRARFEQFARLLYEGQSPEQAFTNALQTSLPAMESKLRQYLDGGQFEPIQWMLPVNLSSAKAMSTRVLTPVEIHFRLGNQLLEINRLDAAEFHFKEALKLAPASALPYEGLGFLAAARQKPSESASLLEHALSRGSTNFLTFYIYAREVYELTADPRGRYRRIPREKAGKIQADLQRAIRLMPDFAPSHQLLGFFHLAQGSNLTLAEQHLQRALVLEPDNSAYRLSLAEAQLRNNKTNAARSTLTPLLLPHADVTLRGHAEEIIRKIGPGGAGR
jgi:tetratricopeptide (TPR) repeat protein